MNQPIVSGTQGYAEEAPLLFERYEQFDFANVHQAVLHLFPTELSTVIDIGAGTGRDAAHMAALGHSVLAVEPTNELREPASTLRPSINLKWMDDSLPHLSKVLARGETFNVVMLNAVWMHLDLDQRQLAMANIAKLTRTGSRVFMSLRHGPVPKTRLMYEVSGDETVALANSCGFKSLLNFPVESIQPANRAAGVSWTRVVLERN